MDQTVVPASTGRVLGSRPSRRLRAEGRLPGVVYGLGADPVSVDVDYATLRDALKTDAGLNTVITLELDGASSEVVIIRDVQRDPIRRTVTHADFLRVDPNQRITVRVPIVLAGDGEAVTNEGGLIEQKLFELEVEVSPMSIPSEIEADQSIMTITRGIQVADLVLPSGVTSLTAGDISVVTPVVPRAAKMDSEDGEELDGEDAASDGGEGGDDAEASDGGDE